MPPVSSVRTERMVGKEGQTIGPTFALRAWALGGPSQTLDLPHFPSGGMTWNIAERPSVYRYMRRSHGTREQCGASPNKRN
jgi:hypothetical protein